MNYYIILLLFLLMSVSFLVSEIYILSSSRVLWASTFTFDGFGFANRLMSTFHFSLQITFSTLNTFFCVWIYQFTQKQRTGRCIRQTCWSSIYVKTSRTEKWWPMCPFPGVCCIWGPQRVVSGVFKQHALFFFSFVKLRETLFNLFKSV